MASQMSLKELVNIRDGIKHAQNISKKLKAEERRMIDTLIGTTFRFPKVDMRTMECFYRDSTHKVNAIPEGTELTIIEFKLYPNIGEMVLLRWIYRDDPTVICMLVEEVAKL
jgi:hypothetical protein